jgi:hypothetical protein
MAAPESDPLFTIFRQEVETRNSIVSLFLSRFTLSNEEIEVLVSRDVPIGKRFFDVVDKAEQIRKDCKVLMEGEEGPTKAGCVPPFSLRSRKLTPVF